MSAELAQATALLTQRDSEKTSVVEELRKLEELTEEGYKGLLNLQVFCVDGLPKDASVKVDFELSDGDLVAKTKELSHKSFSDHVQVLVKSKLASYIDITVHVELPPVDVEITVAEEGEIVEEAAEGATSVAPTAQYGVRLQLSELPDEGEMRWELEGALLGTGESLCPSLPIVHVKTAFDAFALLKIHKLTQLEEAQRAFEEASLRVKEAKKSLESDKEKEKKKAISSSNSPSKKSEKTSKKRAKKSVSSTDSTELSEKGTIAAEKPGPTWVQYAQDAGAASLNFVLTHHAVLLFGAAVAGIYNYGDLASV